MEAACSSKMSVTIYQSVQCNIPEDLTFRFMANLTFQCVEWNSPPYRRAKSNTNSAAISVLVFRTSMAIN